MWRSPTGVVINKAEFVVPQDRMDIDLPGYAWDLLPYDVKPLDLYRSPMWHANYDESKRSPYAAIQTSLGCKFGCGFCNLNSLNTQGIKLIELLDDELSRPVTHVAVV